MPNHDKLTLEALEENGWYAVALPIPDDASKELLIEIIAHAGCFQDIAKDQAKETYDCQGLERPTELEAEITRCCERWKLAEQRLKSMGLVRYGGDWITKEESRKRRRAYILSHPLAALRVWLNTVPRFHQFVLGVGNHAAKSAPDWWLQCWVCGGSQLYIGGDTYCLTCNDVTPSIFCPGCGRNSEIVIDPRGLPLFCDRHSAFCNDCGLERGLEFGASVTFSLSHTARGRAFCRGWLSIKRACLSPFYAKQQRAEVRGRDQRKEVVRPWL